MLVICWFGLLFLTKTREGINTSDHAPDFLVDDDDAFAGALKTVLRREVAKSFVRFAGKPEKSH